MSSHGLILPVAPLTKSTPQFSTIEYQIPKTMHNMAPRSQNEYIAMFNKETKPHMYVTDNESERAGVYNLNMGQSNNFRPHDVEVANTSVRHGRSESKNLEDVDEEEDFYD